MEKWAEWRHESAPAQEENAGHITGCPARPGAHEQPDAWAEECVMATKWPGESVDPCLFETWAQWASIAEPARAQDEAPAQGTGRAAASVAENLPERQRTRWNVPEKNVYPADKQTARVTQTAGTVTSPPGPLENSGSRNRAPAKMKKERPNRRTHWDLGNMKPDCHYDEEEWQVCGHYCPWHQERAEEHHLHYLKK